MKTIFLGTPDFAVPTLKSLVEADKIEVLAVVTQPDKPAGRGHKLIASPVKRLALEHGLKVFQPEKIKEIKEDLVDLKPDVMVLVAFGQFIPKSMLNIAPYGILNVHPSLLPKYRGCNPIREALFNGDTVTGITIMVLSEKMDEGDIVLQQEIAVDEDDNAETLHNKLADLGAVCIKEALLLIKNPSFTPVKQSTEETAYSCLMTRENERINWKQSSEQIKNMVRGMSPYPAMMTCWKGKCLKILKVASLLDKNYPQAGEIVEIASDSFTVSAGQGAVKVLEVKLEGKKAMKTADFLRGYCLEKGIVLE